MFHDDGRASLELAMTTMAVARRHPSFADAVRSSTRRPFVESWMTEFVRFPRWERVLESVGERLPAELPQEWRWLAEREARQLHAAKQSLQLQVLGSIDAREAATAARRLADHELGAETAVWIGVEDCVGIGASLSAESKDVRRNDFERGGLPWHFRSSIVFELRGSARAVVYSWAPVELPVEWAGLLAKRRWTPHDAAAPSNADHEAEVDARYWSAVSEFGAGAGHMINNPLGAIAGLAERLMDDESEPGRRSSLQKIRQQVDRVHRMIRDLHLLGRNAPESRSVASLAEAVMQGVAKAQARLADRETARVAIAALPGDATIAMEFAELVRVVEELTANAIESAGADGFVEVRADDETLSFIDSGPGFSEDERANAFSPFFAGRSAGRGLGMGLPVVRRILERVAGRVVLERRRPTTVTVRLPTADSSVLRRAA